MIRHTQASRNWIEALRSAIGELPRALLATELEALRVRVADLARRDGCPSAAMVAAGGDYRYLRHLLIGGDRDGYEALLIAWPPGHRTPLHDHGGLWGIELVLDGTLVVDEYAARHEDRATTLLLQRSLMLGIGDAAAFSGGDYVHACRNLSANRPCLSLHVYGGALTHYLAFDEDGTGHHRASPQRARIDAVVA